MEVIRKLSKVVIKGVTCLAQESMHCSFDRAVAQGSSDMTSRQVCPILAEKCMESE